MPRVINNPRIPTDMDGQGGEFTLMLGVNCRQESANPDTWVAFTRVVRGGQAKRLVARSATPTEALNTLLDLVHWTCEDLGWPQPR